MGWSHCPALLTPQAGLGSRANRNRLVLPPGAMLFVRNRNKRRRRKLLISSLPGLPIQARDMRRRGYGHVARVAPDSRSVGEVGALMHFLPDRLCPRAQSWWGQEHGVCSGHHTLNMIQTNSRESQGDRSRCNSLSSPLPQIPRND